MLYFVESADIMQEAYQDLSEGNLFIHCFYDERIHPTKNVLNVIYVHNLSTKNTFVFGINHPDIISIHKNALNVLSKVPGKKYIFGKKNISHLIDTIDFIDIEFEVYTKTLEVIETKTLRYNDIKSVPIMKLNKSFNDTLKNIKNYINTEDTQNKIFESEFSYELKKMESNGIYVDRNVFNLGEADAIDDDNYVFCQYNILTPTTRPSNRFKKINFAALNKKNNERDGIVSRFGKKGGIVMVDYESYHLRLFGNHVGFKLPTSSLHEYLGKFYHDKETLTEDEYELSKKITFNLMFGGITDDVRDTIPFMSEIVKYVEQIWQKYNTDGYVETWTYNRKLRKSTYGEMNPYKLFNYLLQSAETERNCKIMSKINNYFENKKSKLILYHYDAFILDMHKSEFKLVGDLVEILSDKNEFPITEYHGSSYVQLTEKND